MNAADRLSDEQVASIVKARWRASGADVLALAREVQHYRAVEAKLRELHAWHHDNEVGVGWCVHCGFGNPVDDTPRCPTIRLLDGEQ